MGGGGGGPSLAKANKAEATVVRQIFVLAIT